MLTLEMENYFQRLSRDVDFVILYLKLISRKLIKVELIVKSLSVIIIYVRKTAHFPSQITIQYASNLHYYILFFLLFIRMKN